MSLGSDTIFKEKADGSAEEQSESTKSAIAFDIALNWWNVGVLL